MKITSCIPHGHDQYNIATMPILEWFNSEPVKQFRRDLLQKDPVSQCNRCYLEESNGGDSKRLRSNQKSVIFTRAAFDRSFEQSPGHEKFLHSYANHGDTVTSPVDLHIDLGNYCNLACKMCNAQASSTIASQEVKWGQQASKQFLGTDWTRDQKVWSNFKSQLLELPNLTNLHLMGGETLLTDRFEDLVDTMIENQRFDLCFSFVTNGTVFKPLLLDKLKKFRRVGIEISMETVDEHNAYQRQGTDTKLVLQNVKRYQEWCNGTSITLTLRPAPSILSIGYYASLLRYALDNQFIVKSNLCSRPRFLSADILPQHIKKLYQTDYIKLISELEQTTSDGDYNGSDPANFKQSVKREAEMCLSLLQTPTPTDSEQQLALMVRHCERWDRVYGYDAKKLYPEFGKILDRYDYKTSS
jgi:sulfatase maturation enzyme AslB (radical SAM superfamily)